MKKRFILIVLAGLFIVSAYSQTPANDPHWSKIWEDEFLNLNNWYCYDHVHNIDNDISVLLTKNVSVQNGKLVIQALREECWFNGKKYDYTSGSVTNYTPGMHYGYIESKMKLPYGKGLWPAFWTFQNTSNPSNAAEIDIFEMLGHLSPTTMTTNLHTCYKESNPNCIESYYKEVEIPYNYTNWITYAIEWTPTKFIWYVDGVAVRNFPNPGIIDPVRIIIGMGINSKPPDQPDNTTPFPAKMEVDYVRLYKLKCDKNTVVTQIPNFNT